MKKRKVSDDQSFDPRNDEPNFNFYAQSVNGENS